MTALEELPNDVNALKRIIAQQQQSIECLKAEQQAAIDSAVKAAVMAILRRYYGPRSERFDPRQLLLFGQHVDTAPLDQANVEEETGGGIVESRVLLS